MGERRLIALDTHALVWWAAEPARVPKRAAKRIEAAIGAAERVVVSSISIWEVAMLADRGRLRLTMDVADWIAHVETLTYLEFVPVDNRLAAQAVLLESFPHRDPADRIITATALSRGATLVTADERLRAYKPLSTLWN